MQRLAADNYLERRPGLSARDPHDAQPREVGAPASATPFTVASWHPSVAAGSRRWRPSPLVERAVGKGVARLGQRGLGKVWSWTAWRQSDRRLRLLAGGHRPSAVCGRFLSG